ncbi:glycosyltransferase family 4 protein [Candidatus Saccharibacteria bacterium]|nr:glycosyltransferase family 4 protein [Candidatus Saccharibacteria bacterium]
MKKKLLIFHPYLATYRVDLYNRFTQDYEVRVVLTGHPNEISSLGFNLEKVNSQAKFDFKYYNNGHFWDRQQITTIYFKAIKDFKPEVVLCHEYGFNTFAAIVLKPVYKYKLFLTCDDSFQMASNYGKKRSILRDFIVKHVDGFLVVCFKTKTFLEKFYLNTKCKFIYFPIIQNDEYLSLKINSSKLLARKYLAKYNLENTKILLYVGRFDPEKNLSLLINSYSKIKTPDDKLILVGGGKTGKEISQQIIKSGLENNVIQTGPLYAEDLYAWYYLADVFVLPSKKEPFGAVVNEALVAGCFCVVSDCAGSQTLIQEEKNGFVFKSENEEDLSQKLCYALKKDKKSVCLSMMPRSFENFYADLISNF